VIVILETLVFKAQQAGTVFPRFWLFLNVMLMPIVRLFILWPCVMSA
jgi:hypothetical protein